MNTTHTVINGDCRDMSAIPSGSVHLVITSPPYWQLKDYGTATEIGFNHSYEEYINHLNLVWQEAYRVLDVGCRLCVNIGDQYARSVYYGRYKVIPIQTEIIRFCETVGFDYLGAIIWQKVATVNTSGGATIMGSFPFPRNGIVKMDYEFILLFKKHGTVTDKVDPARKELSRMSKEEWNTYFQGHWNFPGEKQKAHLAMFPLELPRRLIKMFSYVGDTVLDPFLGSGTTMKAAVQLHRNSIGYEINEEFIPIIEEKVGVEQLISLDQKPQFKFVKKKISASTIEERIKTLPYLFKDPVKLDPIVENVKSVQYGSRIDKDSSCDREEYLRVKRVENLERIVLSNDKSIRLLGVQVNPATQEQAENLLCDLLKNKQLFIRFDKFFPDQESQAAVPCYLYLKNKTLVNAHLIKSGLVHVEENGEYRFKNRFRKYFAIKDR